MLPAPPRPNEALDACAGGGGLYGEPKGFLHEETFERSVSLLRVEAASSNEESEELLCMLWRGLRG